MSDLKSGDYIAGEYRIRRVFGGQGRSGMGVVYLVEGRSSEEPFVLKTFQGGPTNASMLSRFKAEAEMWIQVGKHPNIVQCHWVRNFSNQLFVAAEYIWPDERGRNTLTHHLSGAIPTLQQQVNWIAQFCFGMKHALERGLRAHRDVKPDNLMIDNRGRLRVTDFGLSKSLSHSAAQFPQSANRESDSGLTSTGAALGTPPFMAPEQFVDSSSVDHRADIYSFGVVIYAMASGGRMPISVGSPDAAEHFQQWALAHHHQRVAPLESPLSALTEKCLEKNREHRFQTYDEVLEALASLCHRFGLALPGKEQDSDAPFLSEYAQAQSFEALGRLDDALTKLREMALKWPDRSEIFTELGGTYLRMGKWQEAIEATEKSVKLYAFSTAAWNNLGGLFANRQRFAEAKNAYSKSLLIDPENSGAMIGLAQLHMAAGEMKEAKQLCELALFWRPEKVTVLKIASKCFLRCKDTAKAILALEKLVVAAPDDVVAWFNLALSRSTIGDVRGQLKALQEVLKRSPRDAQAMSFLIQCLCDLGEVDEAIAVCEQIQQITGWEIVGVCKQAQLLAAKGLGMSAYIILNRWVSLHERSAQLWYSMALVLRQAPQYRRQALNAAQNALVCYRENPNQLNQNDCAVLQELVAELSS